MGAAKDPLLWRKSPYLVVGSDDPAAIMDAIVAWMDNAASVYENGDARTQHQDSAWDVAAVEVDPVNTVAIRLQPPTTSTRKNQRVCLMGRAAIGAETPNFVNADAYANKRMYITHVKDVTHGDEGDYNTYDNAAIYAAHDWMEWIGCKTIANCTGVHVYESTEAIAFEFEVDTTADRPVCFAIAGDLLDTSEEGKAEADGGIYCCFTSGYTAAASTTFWTSSYTAAGLFVQGAAAGNSHGWTYTIGGAGAALSGWCMLLRSNSYNSIPTLTSACLGSRYSRWPIYIQNAAGEWIGQMRGVFMVPRRGRVTLQEADTTPVAYFIGGEALDATTDTLGLSAID